MRGISGEFKTGAPTGGSERLDYLNEQIRSLSEWHEHQKEPDYLIKLPGQIAGRRVGDVQMTEDEYNNKMDNLRAERLRLVKENAVK